MKQFILDDYDNSTTYSSVNTVCQYQIFDHVFVYNGLTNDSFPKLYSPSSNKVEVIKTERNGGYYCEERRCAA